MTKWSELTSRERDGFIAWKIMGWKPFQTLGERPWQANLWNDPQGEPCVRDVSDKLAQEGARTLPHYSTDMNAAWQIVERITEPPKTLAESEQMRATRFMYWWEKANLWAMKPEEAARSICIKVLELYGVKIEL